MIVADGVSSDDDNLGNALVIINVLFIFSGMCYVITLLPCCQKICIIPCNGRIRRFVAKHAREARIELGGEVDASKFEMYYDKYKQRHFWVHITTGEVHWIDPSEGMGSLLMRATANKLGSGGKNVSTSKVHPVEFAINKINKDALEVYTKEMKTLASKSDGDIAAVRCVLQRHSYVWYQGHRGQLGVFVQKFLPGPKDADVGDTRNNLLRKRGVRVGMLLISVDGRDCREKTFLEVLQLLQAIKSSPDAKYHEVLLVYALPHAASTIKTLDCEGRYRKGGKDIVTVNLKPGEPLFASLQRVRGRLGVKVGDFRAAKYGGSPAQDQGVEVGMHLVRIDELDARKMGCDHVIQILTQKKQSNAPVSLVFARHSSAGKSLKGLASRIRLIKRASTQVGGKFGAMVASGRTVGEVQYPDAPLEAWTTDRTPDGRRYWTNGATGDVMWSDPNLPSPSQEQLKTRSNLEAKKLRSGRARRIEFERPFSPAARSGWGF
jgi:hypothetical protein